MKINKILFFFLVYSCTSLLANSGSEAGAFLRHKFGTEEMGRGGAAVAWDKVTSFSYFYNPALLPQMEKRFASFTFQFLPLDRNIFSFGVHFYLPPTGALAINLIHIGVDNLYLYNSLGENLGDINFGDDIVYASFAQRITSYFYIGLNLKYILETYDTSPVGFSYHAKGRGVDIGIYSPVNRKIGLGFTITNLAGQIKSNSENIFDRGLEIVDKFPVGFTLGGRINLPHQFKLGMDYQWNTAGKKNILTGVEWEYKELFLRTGSYDGEFHFGAGFLKKIYKNTLLKLDYAFVPGTVGEGTTHMFNWMFIF